MSYFWNKLEAGKTPLCYQTGDWDGKMSDKILFYDKEGKFYVGVCYQGVLDGSEYCSFYDENDFEVDNVIGWAVIPMIY